MERFRIFILFLLVGIGFSSFAQRQVISLNDNWNFSGASIWEESVQETVTIPHTWNTKDAAQGYTYYRGEGIYIKNIFSIQPFQENDYS